MDGFGDNDMRGNVWGVVQTGSLHNREREKMGNLQKKGGVGANSEGGGALMLSTNLKYQCGP